MPWSVGARLLVAGLLFVVAAAAFARPIVEEAAVPVADRSDAARERAVGEALGEVLVRLSGDDAVLQRPGAAAIQAQAGRYLQQYRYEEGATLTLRAGFDAAALEAALRERGLPLWGRTRPVLLVWLAVDDGGRRYLLGADEADPLAGEVQASAQRQGLELVLPLVDLEDQARLGFEDVAGGDLDRLSAASARYGAAAVLAGHLQRAGGVWTGRWAQRGPDGVRRWQGDAADLPTVLNQALARAAELLAPAAPDAAYAGLAASRVPVVIEGVEGLEHYARTLEYLNALPLVQRVELLAVQPGRLDLAAEVQGGGAGLARALEGSDVLAPVPGGLTEAPHYRLLP